MKNRVKEKIDEGADAAKKASLRRIQSWRSAPKAVRIQSWRSAPTAQVVDKTKDVAHNVGKKMMPTEGRMQSDAALVKVIQEGLTAMVAA